MSQRKGASILEVLAALAVIAGLIFMVYRAFVPDPKRWVRSQRTRFLRYLVLQTIFVRFIAFPFVQLVSGGAFWELLLVEDALDDTDFNGLGVTVILGTTIVVLVVSFVLGIALRGEPLPGKPQGRDLSKEELDDLRTRSWARVWDAAGQHRRCLRLLVDRLFGVPPGADWYARELGLRPTLDLIDNPLGRRKLVVREIDGHQQVFERVGGREYWLGGVAARA